MAAEVTAAVGPAVAAAVGPLYNMIATSNNAAAIGIAGRRLIPLKDALGQAPPAGDFPETTDELIAWGTLTRRDVAVWNRLNNLLQYYGIHDPATGQPFIAAGAAVPPQPNGAAGIAELRRRLAAVRAHITL